MYELGGGEVRFTWALMFRVVDVKLLFVAFSLMVWVVWIYLYQINVPCGDLLLLDLHLRGMRRDCESETCFPPPHLQIPYLCSVSLQMFSSSQPRTTFQIEPEQFSCPNH